jgi:predicted Zn-ribbon and HTH transcriptional regulator
VAEPCLVCPADRKRLPRAGLVCDGCARRLVAQLAELPELVDELAARELELGTHGLDPVGVMFPAASVVSKAKAQRVSGTRERPVPLSLDAVDLTSRARGGFVRDALGDQTGQHSVATILDLWVHDLRAQHHAHELLPTARVPDMVAWLVDRIPDACEHFGAIGDFAAEVRRMRSALRAQLGLVAYDDELKDGVQCPKCDSRAALHQANGSDWVECWVCGVLLSVGQYNEWASLLAAGLEWMRGRRCEACGLVNRLYKVRGGDGNVLCGWCHISNINGGAEE